MLTRRKRNRNRSKSIQEKRRLLMESFEVRAAAASLSLPLGNMDGAMQEMDWNDDRQKAAQYDVAETTTPQQLRQQAGIDVSDARSKGPSFGHGGSRFTSTLQQVNRADLNSRASISRLGTSEEADMSPSAWQTTQIDVGLSADALAVGNMSEENLNSVAKTAADRAFRSPAVESNSMENPLTFNHEADASASETISNLLEEQAERLEVAAELGGLASEAALSHADGLGSDPDSLAMIGDVELAPWTSDGVVSVCGSSDAADSADNTLSDTDWHFSEIEQVDMQTQFDTDDIVQMEKQGTSLDQSADTTSKSWTTSSKASASMTSLAGSATHVASASGYESGVTGETSKASALSMVAEKSTVLTPWSSMFDDDSVIEAEHLELVQGYMDELGIESLEEAGTITACDISEQLDAGVHVLQPSLSSSSVMMLPAPGSTLPYVMTDFDGTLEVDGILLAADVVRFDEDVLIDTAVIIADTVILDDAIVTLAANISEFIIVANTVIGYGDSLIQWELSGTDAQSGSDRGQAAAGRDTYPTDEYSSGSAFDAEDGSNGDDGEKGGDADSGWNAPDVHLYLKHFTLEANTTSSIGSYQVAFPDFDLRGQNGGTGGQGEQGGDGGDGAKGAESNPSFLNCEDGVGWGGDGGDGGDGGQGGSGGEGGDGGDLNFYVVDIPQNTYVFSFDYDLSGGEGGDGGTGGDAGSGGDGGDPGDPVGFLCRAEPQRAGEAGVSGDSGQTGDEGTAGAGGNLDIVWIDEEQWEEAFTRAYLVSPSSTEVHVGETIIFDTLNITDDPILTTVDQISGTEREYELTKVADDQYSWTTTTDLDAALLEVFITRAHDGSESNTYRLELLPVLEEVRFGALDGPSCTSTCEISEDPYEALPGGQAFLLGNGFRDGSELVYDGHSLGPVTVLGHSDGRDIIAFTIPVEATDEDYFIREDGLTEHSVYLDQPSGLSDSDSAGLVLLKNSGLVFNNSDNGFSFSNSDMAAAVDGYVTDRFDFNSSSSSLIGDVISDQITVNNHGFETGDQVTYESNASTDIAVTGLTFNEEYYVIVVDDNTIELAATEEKAEDGDNLSITGFSSGASTHSLKLNRGGTLAEAWDLFVDTFGVSTVESGLDTDQDGTLSSFLAWYFWWGQPGSATCMGLSATVLSEFFAGVGNQASTDIGDVMETVAVAQGHLLSPQILGGIKDQGLADNYTATTVDAIVNFFEEGTASDSGEAPVIIMAPEGDVYRSVYNALGEVVNDIQSISGIFSSFFVTVSDVEDFLEGVTTIEDDWSDLQEAVSDLMDGIGESHALAPYQVVYDDPADALPSRIYFYDSNIPGEETYLEIGQDSDGKVTFDYTSQDGTEPYRYGTTEDLGWVLGHLTTDEITSDVDVLFSSLDWLLE